MLTGNGFKEFFSNRFHQNEFNSKLHFYQMEIKMRYAILFLLLVSLCYGLEETWTPDMYAGLAKMNIGIQDAVAAEDGHTLRVALQRSSSGNNTAIAKVVSYLVWTYAKDNQTGILQIGLVNNAKRVTTIWEVSSYDAETNYNNTTWLSGIISNPLIFQDDTRYYDPYGNRYTPIQDGKGLLGSNVKEWLYG
jgi:hypothetical protein